MKKKKKLHESPAEYRITYEVDDSFYKEVGYFSAYHSSEIIKSLAHSFKMGHIQGDKIIVISVEEFNRFSGKWIDRTEKAIEHSTEELIFMIGDEDALSK